MELIDIYYQVESRAQFEFLEVSNEEDFSFIKAALVKRHDLDLDVLIFLEDATEPIAETALARDVAETTGLKIHAHKCRSVEVSVMYNGRMFEHRFAPGTTLGKVKHWVAVNELKMMEEDAGEHVLQLKGSRDRPTPGTHIGTLTRPACCRIALDLILKDRINGASERLYVAFS